MADKKLDGMRLRMAIIGTGVMGRQYAEMIHGGKVPHMKLTAVCCRSDQAVLWAKERLGEAVDCYRSAEEIFAHPESYDGVLIVTPHPSHPDLVCRAFELGKAVFCDKPSGVSVSEARRMEAAAEKAGKVFAMMFHQRLYGRHQRLKEIVTSGELGTLLRVSLVSSSSYRTSAYHASSSWRSSWKGEGGGALINQGQHPLDLFQWLFGMPKELYASIRFGKYNDFSVDDEAMLLMDYENGMTGSFFVTTGEVKGEERLEILGTRGAVTMVGDEITLTRYSQDSREYGKTASCGSAEQFCFQQETGQYPTFKEYEKMLENFAEAVLFGTPLIASGKEGTKALELANAAYLSAWTGKKISFPIDADLYDQMLEEQIRLEEVRKN